MPRNTAFTDALALYYRSCRERLNQHNVRRRKRNAEEMSAGPDAHAMEAAAAAAAVAAAAVAGMHPSLMGHSSDDGSLQQGQARQGRRSIIEDSAVSWGLRRGADGSSEPLDVAQVCTSVCLGFHCLQ